MKNFSTPSFVAGIILGVLLVGAYLIGNDPVSISVLNLPVLPDSLRSLSDGTNNQGSISSLAATGSGAISVPTQPAGDTAAIESVTVPPPGVWVAVREVRGDALGNVLGATRVDGPKSNITVTLLRATEPSRSYAVQLYRDDGNGSFDTTTDSVYVDFDTGAPVITFFTTTP